MLITFIREFDIEDDWILNKVSLNPSIKIDSESFINEYFVKRPFFIVTKDSFQISTRIISLLKLCSLRKEFQSQYELICLTLNSD